MAKSFSHKMQELKRVVKLHANWLIYATLGESALTKLEVEELKNYGKLPMDESLDLTDTSFFLGRMRAIMKRTEYTKVNYQEAVAKKDGKTSAVENLAIEQARLRAVLSLKTVADTIANKTYASLAQALGKAVSDAITNKVDASNLTAAYKKAAQELTSDLANKLQSSNKKNWKAAAQTELHAAKISGTAQTIANKIDIYENSDGPDSYVAVIPAKTCCKDCEDHYLDDDGNPRIFKLSELMSAGSNTDPGTDHTKRQGKHLNWKTTLPPLHPNCGCQLIYIPPGYGWDNGKLTLLNKSLFLDSLHKARSGVQGGIASTVKPKGPPSAAKEPGHPSVPGAAAPGNVAGPGRPPGVGNKPPGGSGGPQYSPCPFGGGSECIKHGGNGATMHKPNGSIMKRHQEAMARGAKPVTPEAQEAQRKQQEAAAQKYNVTPHPRDEILTHLSEGDISSAKALGQDEGKGVIDSYKVTIAGNGSGCMKPPMQFRPEVYEGLFPADGGPSLPKDSTHKSEAAAYQVSLSLGLDHVPPTVIRVHDGSQDVKHIGPTSIQHWQENYKPLMITHPDASDLSFIPKEHKEKIVNKLSEIACLDIVNNNNDRHMNNLVFSEDLSDVKAIDNGFAFAAGMAGHKNAIHRQLHREFGGLKVPDHLMTRFKNQSLDQTMRACEGLTDWQKVQTHLRMKYLAYIQEQHGYIPIEITRYAAVHAQSNNEGSIKHEDIFKVGGTPYRAPPSFGWEADDEKRVEQIKKAVDNWEMPDQLFARFVKSYTNGELGDIHPEEQALLQKMKPAFKTGTGHELENGGVADKHKEAHDKYWDSIPSWQPMSHWPKNDEQAKPLRTPPKIPENVTTPTPIAQEPGTSKQRPSKKKQMLELGTSKQRPSKKKQMLGDSTQAGGPSGAKKKLGLAPTLKAPVNIGLAPTLKAPVNKSLYIADPSARFRWTDD